MKLLLLLVVLIAAFTANCRDFSDGHPQPAFAIEEQDSNVYQQQNKDLKESIGIELRGKKDKENLKILVAKLESLDNKLTSNHAAILSKLNSASASNSQLKTDMTSMKQSLTSNNANILSKLNSISVKLDGLGSARCNGTDRFRVGRQCFQLYRTSLSWSNAKTKCRSVNMTLAEPTDANGPPLRKYVVEEIGNYECWLGAKGDGSKWVWQTSGRSLSKDSSLMNDGRGSSATGRCLELDAYSGGLSSDPSEPYDSSSCTSGRYTLCEVL